MVEIGQDIDKAAQLIRAGEVVGIPTETVYGLAGNALNDKSILKIYSIKNRPKFDPLIAHVDSLDKVERMVEKIPQKARSLATLCWPGPLTILLNKKDSVPDLLTSGLSTVAVRIPDHTLTLKLLSRLDFPLAAPSANPFGYVSPTCTQHVANQFGEKIPYILDGGNCKVGLESTIIGFENDKVIVYRLGGTKVETIEDVIGTVKIHANTHSNPSIPGMLKSHYSPTRKMIIGNIKENIKTLNPKKTGIISFEEFYDVPAKNLVVLSPSGNLEEAARNIFNALRKMDRLQIDIILTQLVPNHGLGKAINDRLTRASTPNLLTDK